MDVYSLADWFRQIHKMMEHGLQVKQKILFKTGKFRSIGNNIKPTEIP